VAVVGLGLLAPSAGAVATLSGEVLQGTATVTCTPGQTGFPMNYQASGPASGPYPGTFTETGAVDNHPGTATASFTIRSGATTITGQKQGPTTDAACVLSFARLSAPQMSYTAQWTATRGNALLATRATYTDSGTSNLGLVVLPEVNSFQEIYTSSQTQATLVKCELVLLSTVAIPIPLNFCPQ
jgi:hypothetical protein